MLLPHCRQKVPAGVGPVLAGTEAAYEGFYVLIVIQIVTVAVCFNFTCWSGLRAAERRKIGYISFCFEWMICV